MLWETPEEPNGVIENYELTFVQGGETKTATTDGDSTNYIIKAESFPQGTDSFMVEVSVTTHIDLLHCINNIVDEDVCNYIPHMQVRARNGAGLGEVLCRLMVDPTEQSIEPQRN